MDFALHLVTDNKWRTYHPIVEYSFRYVSRQLAENSHSTSVHCSSCLCNYVMCWQIYPNTYICNNCSFKLEESWLDTSHNNLHNRYTIESYTFIYFHFANSQFLKFYLGYNETAIRQYNYTDYGDYYEVKEDCLHS